MGYRVKDWTKFQHFKDRRPPWIKLYRDILDNRDIAMISDRCFRVLIGCWLLASEDKTREGLLPCAEDIAFRLRIEKTSVIECLDALCDFVYQDDINPASPCQQVGPSETETEKRQRRDREREARACDRIEEAVYEPHPNMSHDTLLVLNRIREHWPEYDVVQASECAVKLKSYYWDKLDLLAMIDEAWAGWEPGRSIHEKRGVHGYLSAWASNAVEKALRASRAPKNGNGTQGIPYKETAAEAQVRRNHEVLDEWLREKEGNHGR